MFCLDLSQYIPKICVWVYCVLRCFVIILNLESCYNICLKYTQGFVVICFVVLQYIPTKYRWVCCVLFCYCISLKYADGSVFGCSIYMKYADFCVLLCFVAVYTSNINRSL